MKRLLKIMVFLTVFLTVKGFCLTTTNNQTLAAETPAAIGDGLNFTLYDATRSTPEDTKRAMANRDKSIVVMQGKFTRDLSFDMKSWNAPWRWAEITGFIKMPDPDDPADGLEPEYPDNLIVAVASDTKGRVFLELDNKLVLDAWETPVPPFYNGKKCYGSIAEVMYDAHLIPSKEGQYQYINLCIGKNDSIDLSTSLFASDWEHIDYLSYQPQMNSPLSQILYQLKDFPPESFYTSIKADELKPYITVDDKKNTVSINLYGLDVSRYMFGIKSDESSFKAFTSSTGNFGNKDGTLVIREIDDPSSAVELGKVTMNVPPTAPGKLRAGNVLRQGDKVEYSFPDTAACRNLVLGPEREVALRWEPSTDDKGVAGYNIYRVPNVSNVSVKNGLASKEVLIKEHLIGNTAECFFIDKGLEFGTAYIYYVEATDAEGTGSWNKVDVGTQKSTLAGLTVTDGSQTLIPDPAFTYYQTEYTLNVENTVKSITLITKKTDFQAKVTVNGKEAADNGSIGPLKLELGKNYVVVEVVPRQGRKGLAQPETTRYTLTVNRANLDNLPVLTLPESGPLADGVSAYQATGRLDVKDGRVWTGTVDYGDGSGEESLQRAADGSFRLEHNYPDHGKFQINVDFKCEDLGLVKGCLEITVQDLAREQAAEAAVVAYETAPISTLDEIKTAEALGTTASDKVASLANAIIKQRLQARIKAQAEIVSAGRKALEAGAKPSSIKSVSPIITTTLPGSMVGSSYSASLKTENDTPVIWSIDSGSLPDGLSLDAKTGVISGKPTKAGTYTFTVKAASTPESK